MMEIRLVTNSIFRVPRVTSCPLSIQASAWFGDDIGRLVDLSVHVGSFVPWPDQTPSWRSER